MTFFSSSLFLANEDTPNRDDVLPLLCKSMEELEYVNEGFLTSVMIRETAASTAFYGSFNLDMDRSPGFGSAHTDSGPLKTWFPYGSIPKGFNLASMHNSPDRSTKSTRFII